MPNSNEKQIIPGDLHTLHRRTFKAFTFIWLWRRKSCLQAIYAVHEKAVGRWFFFYLWCHDYYFAYKNQISDKRHYWFFSWRLWNCFWWIKKQKENRPHLELPETCVILTYKEISERKKPLMNIAGPVIVHAPGSLKF